MKKQCKPLPEAVVTVINEAVKRAVTAAWAERDRRKEDCCKQTVRRIRALPILRERVAANRARLSEDGDLIPGRSKSIVRFTASGCRVNPEEMLEAVRQSVEAHIAADQQEIDAVTAAMDCVKEDFYFPVLTDGLAGDKTEAQLAEALFCDESTVRRNRSRLIRVVAIRLYGVEAVG